MANTVAQKKAREWIVNHWMKKTFEMTFSRKNVLLSSGGLVKIDAVSEDGTTASIISTSKAETPGDKVGRGKLSKLRADLYFLLLATGVKRYIIVFTEKSMYALADKEKRKGLIPHNVEIFLATITDKRLRDDLDRARDGASNEMTL
ncbi:MAG: hypothetical protein ABFD08_09355 [Syntrophomonas sp.]